MDYIIIGLAIFGMFVFGVNLTGLVWIIIGLPIPDRNLTSAFLLEGTRELEKIRQKSR
jgi:hypothetical protein